MYSEFIKIDKDDPNKVILDLYSRKLGDTGVKIVADYLKINTVITHVDLANNAIGDEGMKALSEAIKVNSSIKYISLHSNNIEDEGIEALSKALEINSSIVSIDLNGNRIHDRGFLALTNTLKINQTIKYIYLYFMFFDEWKALNVFKKVLRYNYTIEKIGFEENIYIEKMLKPKNRKQRIIEWMPWKNHHVCIKLEPRFHDIILILLYLFFISQIFLRREKRKLRQQKIKILEL